MNEKRLFQQKMRYVIYKQETMTTHLGGSTGESLLNDPVLRSQWFAVAASVEVPFAQPVARRLLGGRRFIVARAYQTISAIGKLYLGPYELSLLGQMEAVILVVLVVTIYREQVQERQRQQFVDSEMRSAREMQSVLVPEETPAVPGFAIGSLYWPAGEVGGDMFQVLPGESGDVTVVLADVSGKGLKAAMTVSLMVGAVRTLADATTSPMAILAGLNKRLMGRTDGGFSTCLVLHITANGEVTMANAGPLAPFLNGEAMAIDGSLPLGIVAGAEFSESRFSLREGDEVSLYTDGVLEAQNEAGEAFGFQRCESLMRKRPSVQQIAEAAKAFGQQDDITVVKVARVCKFSEVSAKHAIAVALGLLPLLAQWALGLVDLAGRLSGSTMLAVTPRFGSDLAIYGLIALSQGSLLISMVWAAALAYMFDRRFLAAAAWMGAAAAMSFFGLVHSFAVTPEGVVGDIGWAKMPGFTLSYAGGALFLLFCHWYSKQQGETTMPGSI